MNIQDVVALTVPFSAGELNELIGLLQVEQMRKSNLEQEATFKPLSKAEVLEDFEAAITELKLIKAGKLKSRPASALIDEL